MLGEIKGWKVVLWWLFFWWVFFCVFLLSEGFNLRGVCWGIWFIGSYF